jgi:hypothetical protein
MAGQEYLFKRKGLPVAYYRRVRHPIIVLFGTLESRGSAPEYRCGSAPFCRQRYWGAERCDTVINIRRGDATVLESGILPPPT